jgi:carboxypeptidase family protein
MLVAIAASGALQPLHAQTIEGRVFDDQDDRPVATALVRLVNEDGKQQAVTAADSSGFYRIVAPEPGVYRLQAERLGYDAFESPLLETLNPDGVYPLDLLMRRSPIPIPGFEVTTVRADEQIRLTFGMRASSLRTEPIRSEEIQGHVERAHNLTGLMRWGESGNLVVSETTEGPCYSARARGCLDVYLNRARLNPKIFDSVPLDMIHTVVILYPNESIAYPYGGVFLYTAAWLR